MTLLPHPPRGWCTGVVQGALTGTTGTVLGPAPGALAGHAAGGALESLYLPTLHHWDADLDGVWSCCYYMNMSWSPKWA